MTHTFTLIHHTSSDMSQRSAQTQGSMQNTVSIGLQAWTYDYRERQILGHPYLYQAGDVDTVIDRLIVELEVIRKQAKAHLVSH